MISDESSSHTNVTVDMETSRCLYPELGLVDPDLKWPEQAEHKAPKNKCSGKSMKPRCFSSSLHLHRRAAPPLTFYGGQTQRGLCDLLTEAGGVSALTWQPGRGCTVTELLLLGSAERPCQRSSSGEEEQTVQRLSLFAESSGGLGGGGPSWAGGAPPRFCQDLDLHWVSSLPQSLCFLQPDVIHSLKYTVDGIFEIFTFFLMCLFSLPLIGDYILAPPTTLRFKFRLTYWREMFFCCFFFTSS